MLKIFFKNLFTFSSLLLITGIFWAGVVRADYYAEGVLRSVNLLAGVDEVTAINSFTATTTLPLGTSAYVKFSEDRVNYVSTTGTPEYWEELADGVNSLDLSGLAWSGQIFYYKLKLATTIATATPELDGVALDYGGTAGGAMLSAQREGVFLSGNMLAGKTVTAVNAFLATTTIPSGTTVFVQFSGDNANFTDSAGTANAWDSLTDGANSLDISGLTWTSGLFYRLKLASIDSHMSPEILEVNIDYDGADSSGASGNYSAEGYFVSANLLTGSSTFARPAYFAYTVDALPSGTTLSAQFSKDGVNWFDSAGTAWGYDTLVLGSFQTRETALSLGGLDSWNGEEEFYYKLKFTTNNAYSPEISSAGLINANRLTVGYGGVKATSSILYLPFDEGYGATAHDESGFGNDGTLYPGTGGANTATSAMWSLSGKYGGAMEFDGVDDRIAISNFQFSIFNQFSISQFINFQTLSASKPLLSHWGTNQYSFLVKTDDTNSDELKICVADALTDNCANYAITSNANLNASGWHHLIVAYNGDGFGNAGKLKVYLNGRELGLTFTGTLPSTFTDSGDEVEIGGGCGFGCLCQRDY